MNDALSIDDILAAEDRPIRREDAPEWGGTIFLRAMTGDERDRYDQLTAEMFEGKDDGDDEDWRGLRALHLSMTMCDADGERIAFTAAQRKGLGNKSSAVLVRLTAVANRLNGMGTGEELEKNSEGGPSDSCGSSSPSSSASLPESSKAA